MGRHLLWLAEPAASFNTQRGSTAAGALLVRCTAPGSCSLHHHSPPLLPVAKCWGCVLTVSGANTCRSRAEALTQADVTTHQRQQLCAIASFTLAQFCAPGSGRRGEARPTMNAFWVGIILAATVRVISWLTFLTISSATARGTRTCSDNRGRQGTGEQQGMRTAPALPDSWLCC